MFSSRRAIQELVDFAKKTRTQTLFVQVYRANKSWFSSKIADSSPYEMSFKNVGEDAFRLLIKKAHAQGIKVHAWLNLLSLSTNVNAPLLKKYGPEILTRNLKEKNTVDDYKIDNQYFLEPGDLRVQDALSAIVGEVVSAYPELDGIQLDYIRYPDVHPAYGFTKMNMDRFKKSTGIYKIDGEGAAWKQWKYDQVTGLVRRLVRKARSIHPGIQASTTGLMPYSRASLESFQDWHYWLQSGLVDFVTLMCYTDDVDGFKKYIFNAKNKIGDLKKINIAVGAYKLLALPDTFKKQFEICEESGSRACVVLHYGSLTQNPALTGALTDRKNVKPFSAENV